METLAEREKVKEILIAEYGINNGELCKAKSYFQAVSSVQTDLWYLYTTLLVIGVDTKKIK